MWQELTPLPKLCYCYNCSHWKLASSFRFSLVKTTHKDTKKIDYHAAVMLNGSLGEYDGLIPDGFCIICQDTLAKYSNASKKGKKQKDYNSEY